MCFLFEKRVRLFKNVLHTHKDQIIEIGGIKIKRYFIAFAIILVFLIAGCNSSEKIGSNELEKFEVKKTTDETIQDDFVFRLVSEKEQYKEGEDVKLYGEIIYNGDKEEVNIHHSSSAIYFDVLEETRGHEIGYVVNDIGLSTTLNRLGNSYRKQYKKSVGYSPDNTSKDYEKFMEGVLNKDGFPPGYYIVKGTTDFSVESEGDLEQEKYNIEATIDFKVVD